MKTPATNPSADAAPQGDPQDAPSWLLPGLTPVQERKFEADYYARVRPSLRVMAPLLAALFAACAARDYADTHSLGLAAAQDGAPAVFFLAVLALTWMPAFGRVWQPVLAAAGLTTVAVSLRAMAGFLAGSVGPPDGGAHPGPPTGGAELFFGQQMCLLMVCLTVLRLRFRWALALQASVLGVGVWEFLTHLAGGVGPGGVLTSFLRPVVAILAAVLLAALVSEQLSIRAFVTGQLLEEERNDERRRREQTEGQLRVLAQAIGGIVHDLGNPLTAVQLGADLLDLRADARSAAMNQEIIEAIQEGAEMLGALRLSLIEQTRVLEGKPIPVDLRAEPLRPIVAAGARFQSPRLASGRVISLTGEEVEVCADRLKLVTVFMNLIGNALKYSDGEVHVIWRAEGDTVLVGVLDQGMAGRGISEAQASQLFVPFGRLDAHASVEGTGLGLVSARKIVEAHGGAVFIEGHQDGTAASPPFRTAAGDFPSLLAPGLLTGFVLACPVPRLPSATPAETHAHRRSSIIIDHS